MHTHALIERHEILVVAQLADILKSHLYTNIHTQKQTQTHTHTHLHTYMHTHKRRRNSLCSHEYTKMRCGRS